MKSRDRLYSVTMVCTAVFAVLSIVLMIGFKKYEAFFDSHSHIGMLAEKEVMDAIEEKQRQEYNYQFMKKNIDIEIEDLKEGVIKIPLKTAVTMDDVDIRHEFTKNKYVITIKNIRNAIDTDSKIISDSLLMDAFGAYNIKDDTVIEIFYNKEKAFCCDVDIDEHHMNLDLSPIKDGYEHVAMVTTSFLDRTRLSELKIDKFDNTLVLSCGQLQEEYTNNELVEYANKLYADMLVNVGFGENGEKSYMKVIYNPDYYIPEFGSTDLAKLSSELFAKRTGYELIGFRGCKEDEVIVSQAKVPSTEVIFNTCYGENNALEVDYNLNHGMMSAIEDIIKERCGY